MLVDFVQAFVAYTSYIGDSFVRCILARKVWSNTPAAQQRWAENDLIDIVRHLPPGSYGENPAAVKEVHSMFQHYDKSVKVRELESPALLPSFSY